MKNNEKEVHIWRACITENEELLKKPDMPKVIKVPQYLKANLWRIKNNNPENTYIKI